MLSKQQILEHNNYTYGLTRKKRWKE